MTSKFIKKPQPLEIVEAGEWNKEGDHSRVMGANPNLLCGCILFGMDGNRPHIHPEGKLLPVVVHEGDWIVKHQNGNFSVWDANTFAITYIKPADYTLDLTALSVMTNDERKAIFDNLSSKYCMYCGSEDPTCQCGNDTCCIGVYN